MLSRNSKLGVLLVGHGTASAVGTQQFRVLARQLADRMSPAAVEPAFLEMQQPDIAKGLRQLADRGAEQIVVAPLLLFAAGHAKQDIPAAAQSALTALTLPRPTVVHAAHLGCHPAIVQLSRRRLAEALSGQPPIAPDSTALVLVGRGSRDQSATAEMHELTRLAHDPATARDVFVGFLAMAQPLLADVLRDVASRGFQRIIVQPHLLFAGDLAESVEWTVAEVRLHHPKIEWLLAPLLADPQDSPASGNEFLLQAMLARVMACSAETSIHVVAAGQDY
jgi:sirohydrochlorin cobaltochelatase